MINNYNPFKIKGIEKTFYGRINYDHNIGITYVTHRKPQHYFKKHKGFGISNSEIEIAQNKRVYWILIIYHNNKGEDTAYRIPIKKTKTLQEYNNGTDIQRIIPVKQMQQHTEQGWL